ncbi:hypothetical protein Syun_011482 [Stephania yunnanensis]|uniref:Uncharacterized protein n=1 Tax=Stephania yunnanensis TaxID=152371 RepID=A0AAP0K005_9MAGN
MMSCRLPSEGLKELRVIVLRLLRTLASEASSSLAVPEAQSCWGDEGWARATLLGLFDSFLKRPEGMQSGPIEKDWGWALVYEWRGESGKMRTVGNVGWCHCFGSLHCGVKKTPPTSCGPSGMKRALLRSLWDEGALRSLVTLQILMAFPFEMVNLSKKSLD